MPHSQHYKENFDAVLDIPVVKELLKQNNKLIKRNKKLSKRNKILKNLIYSLPEFRNPCNSCSCNHNKQKSCRDNVVVKTEKKYTETGSQSEDNDIIILDTPAKEEIKYEILEIDNEEEAESEEAEEEEAEEEEEEVFETTINGKEYYTVCLMNGFIYEIMPDEDIGDEVGKFVNGKAVFDK